MWFEKYTSNKANDLKHKLKKGKLLDKTWIEKKIKLLTKKGLSENEIKVNNLLNNMNNLSYNDFNDENKNGLTDLDSKLYFDEELSLYSFYSKSNNFNILKFLWVWIEGVYKALH